MPPKISIHVDGYYGLTQGVKNLLDLFDRYDLRVTFFVNMGREANLFETLKYRARNLEENDKKIVKRYSKIQLLKIILLQRKIGSGHSKILKEILKRGHDVQPHAWSHLRWSKNFDKMNYKKEIYLMKKAFFKSLRFYPTKFAPPTWKISKEIILYLGDMGFKEICVLPQDLSKFKEIKNPKADILSFDKTPEELLQEGKTMEEVIKIYKQEFTKKNAHLYFHADYEGIAGINLFDKILKENLK